MASMSTKPVPEGLHTLTPHFVVRDAAKAVDFYQRAFGAEEVDRMTGPDGRIWHVRLRIGTSSFFLAEEGTAQGALSPQALGGSPGSLQMYVDDAGAAFQRAIDAGAQVRSPLADTFWGDRYGQLIDPFGFQWAIAQRVRDLSPEELAHAVKAAARFHGEK
jgi:uncharacterized glyoxalase superfamily protein PhnB